MLFCSYNIKAIMGKTAPFIVMDTDISSKRGWSKKFLHILNGIYSYSCFSYIATPHVRESEYPWWVSKSILKALLISCS
jgi:hypothetical protein